MLTDSDVAQLVSFQRAAHHLVPARHTGMEWYRFRYVER